MIYISTPGFFLWALDAATGRPLENWGTTPVPLKDFPKSDFPTQRVYGAKERPQLRLLTCGGAYDGDEYTDNVIVFASLRQA